MAFYADDDDGGNCDEVADDDNDGVEASENSSYYLFMHVSRNASQDEITAAYKRLSRLYHPDKHVDEEKKRHAEELFSKLKKVYDVLGDPHKRAIYDSVGEKGIDNNVSAVVPIGQTPEEIRQAYERMAKAREAFLLQKRINPTSRLVVSVDASDIFEAYDDDEDDMEWFYSLLAVEVSGITLAQTIEAPLTLTDKAVLAGNVKAANGKGSGSLGCALRRSNRLVSEVDFSIGDGSHVGFKLNKMLRPTTFVNMAASAKLFSTDVTLTLNQVLHKRVTGSVAYSTQLELSRYAGDVVLVQNESGVGTSLDYNDGGKNRATGTLMLNSPSSVHFMLSASRRVGAAGATTLRANLRLGTFGVIVEGGVSRKITRQSTLGASMAVGNTVGVTLKLKMTRAAQYYEMPILLSSEVLPQTIIYGMAAPLLAWFALKKFVLDPRDAAKEAEKKIKQKRANEARLAQAKKEAGGCIELMRERYARILDEETASRGLVVLVALYGKIVDGMEEICRDVSGVLDACKEPGDSNSQISQLENVIDVTIPVQCLVDTGSRLVLFEGSKSELAGFYDPGDAGCDDNRLVVRYTYQEHLHQVVLSDRDAVRLPKSAHRIQV